MTDGRKRDILFKKQVDRRSKIEMEDKTYDLCRVLFRDKRKIYGGRCE